MQSCIERSVLALTALVLFGTPVVQAVPLKKEAHEKDDFISYRLPNNTRPISYDIDITTRVDKGDFTFTGQVDIFLIVVNETHDITIHARQLTINFIELKSQFFPSVYPTVYSYDNETEFLRIYTGVILKPGGYTLRIKYEGELRKDNAGFYLSTYTDDNGNTVNLATTQFEATDARHAFPCYDEPAMKASFRLYVTHGSNYTAISNMPAMENPVDNEDGTSTTSFAATYSMSTYLLAFIISDFKSTELTSKIPHRVFSRNNTKNEQRFGLETSGKTLEAIGDYLNVPYDLPKMDNAAIPDFAAGAMENWGLVTYKEDYLLYNEGQSTTQTQIRIALTIAHEFGHQWFGNLVSPLWWTYAWLNEGFASIFAYIASSAVFPEWDLWQVFHVSEFQTALRNDGEANPRPMTDYVEAPSDISKIFDSVIYSKAASVLIMLRHAFTESTFKKALYNYLNKLEYKFAEEDDLFLSFVVAIGEDNIFPPGRDVDLFKMLKSWTNQGGFPLITVTRNYDKGTFVITQQPFNGDSAPSSTDKRSWWVPFNFAAARNPNFNETEMYDYLNVGESSKEISSTAEKQWENSDWIVLNKRSTAYYRVNYDIDNWKLITLALTKDLAQFHVNNRAQLLDDSFRLAAAKILKFEIYFELSLYLQNENDYAPWMTADQHLSELNLYLNGDSEYELFQFYVQKMIENFYETVRYTENMAEEPLLKILRNVAINWACRANYGDCLDMTSNRLREYIDFEKKIEPDLRASIFCNGLTKAGEKEFNYLLKEVMTSKDQAFRSEMMASVLGCVQDVTLLQQYLQTSIQTNGSVNYRAQERTSVIPGVVDKGPIQLAVVINFLIENHAQYHKLLSGWSNVNPLLTVTDEIAEKIVSEQQKAQFEQLLAKLKDYKDIPQSDLDQLRDRVKANLEWIKGHRDELISWLKNFKKDPKGPGGGATAIALSITAMTVATFISISSLLQVILTSACC
ncbi:aminopeptidase N-like isoform X1 [Hermetia illucens]|uniref:aminopeptidase N-like isoform X1 n=1 Tax=Hermetia illucens TaxID=343691 RepID=UPI0018CC4ACB|nr:aminopeptidase N-like isoform X1 [Hermetia illucens]